MKVCLWRENDFFVLKFEFEQTLLRFPRTVDGYLPMLYESKQYALANNYDFDRVEGYEESYPETVEGFHLVDNAVLHYTYFDMVIEEHEGLFYYCPERDWTHVLKPYEEYNENGVEKGYISCGTKFSTEKEAKHHLFDQIRKYRLRVLL